MGIITLRTFKLVKINSKWTSILEQNLINEEQDHLIKEQWQVEKERKYCSSGLDIVGN